MLGSWCAISFQTERSSRVSTRLFRHLPAEAVEPLLLQEMARAHPAMATVPISCRDVKILT
jgi:hypothetical protein